MAVNNVNIIEFKDKLEYEVSKISGDTCFDEYGIYQNQRFIRRPRIFTNSQKKMYQTLAIVDILCEQYAEPIHCPSVGIIGDLNLMPLYYKGQKIVSISTPVIGCERLTKDICYKAADRVTEQSDLYGVRLKIDGVQAITFRIKLVSGREIVFFWDDVIIKQVDNKVGIHLYEKIAETTLVQLSGGSLSKIEGYKVVSSSFTTFSEEFKKKKKQYAHLCDGIVCVINGIEYKVPDKRIVTLQPEGTRMRDFDGRYYETDHPIANIADYEYIAGKYFYVKDRFDKCQADTSNAIEYITKHMIIYEEFFEVMAVSRHIVDPIICITTEKEMKQEEVSQEQSNKVIVKVDEAKINGMRESERNLIKNFVGRNVTCSNIVDARQNNNKIIVAGNVREGYSKKEIPNIAKINNNCFLVKDWIPTPVSYEITMIDKKYSCVFIKDSFFNKESQPWEHFTNEDGLSFTEIANCLIRFYNLIYGFNGKQVMLRSRGGVDITVCGLILEMMRSEKWFSTRKRYLTEGENISFTTRKVLKENKIRKKKTEDN